MSDGVAGSDHLVETGLRRGLSSLDDPLSLKVHVHPSSVLPSRRPASFRVAVRFPI